MNQNSRSPYTSHCFCTDWDDTDCQLKGNKIKCSSLAFNSCLLKYRYMSMYTTWHAREQIDCDRGESVLWFWKVNRRCGQIEVFLKLKCFGKAKAMHLFALYYWLNWLQRPLLTRIHRHNQTFPNFALCLQRLNLHALWCAIDGHRSLGGEQSWFSHVLVSDNVNQTQEVLSSVERECKKGDLNLNSTKAR